MFLPWSQKLFVEQFFLVLLQTSFVDLFVFAVESKIVSRTVFRGSGLQEHVLCDLLALFAVLDLLALLCFALLR